MIRQIPRLLGPGLNKAGKFPTLVTHQESLVSKIDELQKSVKFQLKKVLCIGVAVGNVNLTEEQIVSTSKKSCFLLLYFVFVYVCPFYASYCSTCLLRSPAFFRLKACLSFPSVLLHLCSQVANIQVTINFLISLLKKGWQNVKTLNIKTTMGKPHRIY